MICTFEARIDRRLAPDILGMQKELLPRWNRMARLVWHHMDADPSLSNQTHINWLKKGFGIKERTANSIVRTMKARRSALLALKKTELANLKRKTAAKKKRYMARIKTLNNLKVLARDNKLCREHLEAYRKEKRALHEMRQWIDRKENRIRRMKEDIRDRKVSLCFGSKKLFSAQYHLKENGFRSRSQWRKEYRRRRDRMIAYIPRSEETFGNQMCHLSKTDTPGLYTVSILPDISEEKIRSRPVQGLVRISYGHEILDGELDRHSDRKSKGKPIMAKILRRGHSFYLQTSVEADEKPTVTSAFYGMIGLDFNKDFIQSCETDEHGNIVRLQRYPFHGRHSLLEQIKKIVSAAREAGKDIAYEDLDFISTKASVMKGSSRKGKNYNRMLHSLKYSAYKEGLKRRGIKDCVKTVPVDPAYTSRHARPYAEDRKLNIHSGAAWMIARRASGQTS